MNFASALLTVLLSVPGVVSAQESNAATELGRRYCGHFYGSEFAAIWNELAPAMREVFGGSLDGLKQFGAQVESQLGKEQEVLSESTQVVGETSVYFRVARFEKFTGTIDVRWQFESNGKVVALSISPSKTEAPTRFLEYQTKTALHLPFKGPWDVFWGGRSLAENYHAAYPDQRFAYDILIMKDGASHSGDGKRNEDYHCYSKELVAPGAGTVVAIEKDVEDNVPGVMNPAQALGNHVIIDHGNGEFSFLAHFKQGSVCVEKGATVKAGQLLGLAGNSGNTSEPHLHYHLQTTSVFNQGEGLPSQFLNYVADGVHVQRGEPVKGQVIEG